MVTAVVTASHISQYQRLITLDQDQTKFRMGIGEKAEGNKFINKKSIFSNFEFCNTLT